MKKELLLTSLAAVCAVALMNRSALGGENIDKVYTPVMIAKFTTEPVKLDGKLDEAAWAKAPAYSQELPLKAYANMPEVMQRNIGTNLREKGAIKLLWDDKYLYVGAQLDDSDVVAEGKEDQAHLYTMGDLIEVFLKPAQESYYWEIYGAPNNKKTCFFYPSRGCLFIPSCGEHKYDDLNVGATVDGTLNEWKDKDKGWAVEIAIPISELTRYGAKFDNPTNWTILVARYNYSRYLPTKELSAYPLLSAPSYHIYEDYAKLLLEK